MINANMFKKSPNVSPIHIHEQQNTPRSRNLEFGNKDI